METNSEVPDPLEQAAQAVETVHITKADFDLLMSAVSAVQDDVGHLAAILGFTELPDGVDPHTIMVTMLLPKVVSLVQTQRHVDEAGAEMKKAASRFGNKTKDFGNGVKGLKVGQRLPPEAFRRG